MMRHALPTLLLALAASLSLSAPAGPAPEPSAFPFVQTDEFRLSRDQSIADELWVLARNIRIDGDSRSDLFLFAGASRLGFPNPETGVLAMNGLTGGDLWAAARKIELAGNVEHHARLACQMLRVNGRIGGNLWTAATTVSLETNAIIVGSARILTDYFILRGTVDGNLHVVARKVVLDGVVNGAAVIKAGEITVLSNTRIGGDLVCESPTTVTPDSRAMITGKRVNRKPVEDDSMSIIRLVGTFLSFAGAILAGIFFFYFSPRLAVRSTLWMEINPWRTLMVGMAGFILVPFALVFAFASLLGIPLALVAGALYGLAVYLGRFVAALSIARLLTGVRRRQPMPLPSPRLLLIGLCLFYLAMFLPAFIADAIWFWFTVSGMGGLILGVRGSPIPLFVAPPTAPAPVSNPEPKP